MSQALHKYFTTGEFAKLCNVKKQTLFHYEKLVFFPLKSPTTKDIDTTRITNLMYFPSFNYLKKSICP